MTLLRPHDLYDRVVVVAPCWMDRDARWLVYYNHVVIFMNNAYRLSGHGRLVPMESVRYDVSIFHDFLYGTNFLAIDGDIATLNGIFLESINHCSNK